MSGTVYGGVMTQTVTYLTNQLICIREALAENGYAQPDEELGQLHERVRELAQRNKRERRETKMEVQFKITTPGGTKTIALVREFKEVNGKRTAFWIFTPHGKTQNAEERNKPISGTPLKAATWVAAEFYGGATKIVRTG